jgi:hypothetical protein
MVISSPISYIEGMKKVYLSVVLLCIASMAGAVDFEISTGLGYGLYGISAESNGFKADIYYHTAGLELGLNVLPVEFLETHLGLYLGLPLGADIYKNGQYYTSPDLSIYDRYKQQISLFLGASYRHKISDWNLSAGPYLVINNVVLTSSVFTGSYLYSYTLGTGLSLKGEYTLDDLGFFGELKGHMNFKEYLVFHTDFVPSLSGGLTLGIIWKL